MKPILEKISIILFLTTEIGWRDPILIGSPGLEMSFIFLFSEDLELLSLRASTLS